MAEISAQLVKDLRQKTGAGMMDCKKALTESDGDLTKAMEWLRQKGITSAEKKQGRTATEGIIDSYIHTGGHIGVLVEVNCETDFVARREEFQTIVRDIAMQIAAYGNIQYVSTNDIPDEIFNKERDIEKGREDLEGKPDHIKEQIIKGRVDKRLQEMSLLDQPFVKDQSITVEEYIKQGIATLGENIQVRRFARFVLGEGANEEDSSDQ